MQKTLLIELADKLTDIANSLKAIAASGHAVAESQRHYETSVRNQEEIGRLVAQNTCLYCGEPLGDSLVVRGVHQSCYQAMRRNNEVEICFQLGRILGNATPGRKPEKTLEQQLQKAAKTTASTEKELGRTLAAEFVKSKSTKKRPGSKRPAD